MRVINAKNLVVGTPVQHDGNWSDTRGATGFIEYVCDKYVFIRWTEHPNKSRLGMLGIKKYKHSWVEQSVLITGAVNMNKPSEPNNDQWIIWTPQGANPKVFHNTYDGAEHESRRLAKQNPGTKFFVCKLVAVSETDCVRTTKL